MRKGIFCAIVCMLMIVSTIVPVSGTTVSKKTSQPLTMGNTLYVGGLGPNNYTKIQDAIDTASAGDTVFVYDDSSPYTENVCIPKSINLIGEYKQTTIIDGGMTLNTPAMQITADDVVVQGFTIQTTPYKDNGIESNSSKNIIKNNIIKHCYKGIELDGFSSRNLSSNSSVIEDNDIYEDTEGVCVYYSHFNTISHNHISSLILGNCHGNLITLNNITDGENGIAMWRGVNNTILKNNIINHSVGIVIDESGYNSILQNNIYRNTINTKVMAFTIDNLLMRLKSFNQTWDGNYWGRIYKSAKPIIGCSILVLPSWLISFPISVLTFFFFEYTFSIPIGIPVIKYDRHPAQEPYDIPLGV
jgi:parallel beta-helix repeat protein